MNRTLFSQQLRDVFYKGKALVQWGIDQIRVIYKAPFSFDSTAMLTYTPAQWEQRRRIDLLRIIILTFLGVEICLGTITVILGHVPSVIRFAQGGQFLLGIGCLLLSSRRYAAVASFIYEFGSFVTILFLVWSDPGGLNQRSLLIYSMIALIIIGTGLVLPLRAIVPTSLCLMGIALLSVLIEPIKTPVPSTIVNPHLLAFFTLLPLYAFTLILTQIFTGNTRASTSVLLLAYERERVLEAMTEEFLHIASHELRAPLTPIILTSSLIKQRSNQPDRQGEIVPLANDLVNHARRMSEMVEVLLDSTRIHAGKFDITRIPCDVANIMQDAVTTQQMQWPHQIRLEGAAHPIQGVVDPQRLWQLTTNLLSNALKYSPKTSVVEVAVAVAHAAPDTTDWLHLSVTDHGAGIAPEYVAHLFDRFYRGAHADSVSHVDGLGLGLYICHAIVTAHGGTIEVESVVGTGTTFRVALPLVAAI